MAALLTNQQDRWQQLQQLHAQVQILEVQNWNTARAAKTGQAHS
jgi:hypothetical protein